MINYIASIDTTTIRRNPDYHPVGTTHFNPPEFLYEYTDNKVKCKYCESIFSHKYLIGPVFDDTYSDSIKLMFNDVYNDTICPVCGEWNCCNIEYETLEHALGRIGKTKKEII